MNDSINPADITLLDTAQIEMLIEAGASESIELVTELIDLYESESLQKLEDLKTGKARNDLESMGRSAHALSGSSANVGGNLVWKMAKQMENYCKENKGAAAIEMLPALEEAHQRTLVGLREYVENYCK